MRSRASKTLADRTGVNSINLGLTPFLFLRKPNNNMARKNKMGTPFLGLGFEKEEVKAIKKHLKDSDISAKQYLRFLVRQDLKSRGFNFQPTSIYRS